jgi:hypothetical protein
VRGREIAPYHTPNHHTMSGHKETHSRKDKGPSIRRDGRAASIKHILSTQASLSEHEDTMSSDAESFDDEDMYPANYNDESVSNSPDLDSDRESQSSLRGLVCALLYIMFTYLDT